MSDMDMDISLAWWLCDSTETKKKTGHPCRVRRTDCAWTWIDWTENCKVLFVHVCCFLFVICFGFGIQECGSWLKSTEFNLFSTIFNLVWNYRRPRWGHLKWGFPGRSEIRNKNLTWNILLRTGNAIIFRLKHGFSFSFLWCFLSVHNFFYFDFDLQFLAFCPSVFPKDLMKDFFTMHGISGERFLWGHKLLVQILSVKEYILGAFGRKSLRELLPVKGMVVSHHMPVLRSLKR